MIEDSLGFGVWVSAAMRRSRLEGDRYHHGPFVGARFCSPLSKRINGSCVEKPLSGRFHGLDVLYLSIRVERNPKLSRAGGRAGTKQSGLVGISRGGIVKNSRIARELRRRRRRW